MNAATNAQTNGQTNGQTNAPANGHAGRGATGRGWPVTLADVMKLEAGLSFKQVEQRLGTAVRAGGLAHCAIAFYLAEVDCRRLHALAGCRSASQYASVRFGMSPREARDLIAAGRALRTLPLLDEAFARGEVCWSKVRQIIRVATAEHEARWVEFARTRSIHDVLLEVRSVRAGGAPRDGSDRLGLPATRLKIELNVSPEVHERWERTRERMREGEENPLDDSALLDALLEGGCAGDGASEGGSEHQEQGSPAARREPVPYAVHVNVCPRCREASVETEAGPMPIAAETGERLACSAGTLDIEGGKTTRRPPAALWRRVQARDGHRCRCCRTRGALTAHHVTAWSEGGETGFENLISVCRRCHGLIHEGLIVIRGKGPGDWHLEDRDGNDLNGAAERNGVAMPMPVELGGCGGENGTMRSTQPVAVCGQEPGTTCGTEPGTMFRAALATGAAHVAAREPVVTLADVPAEIDGAWWDRHASLIRWSERAGVFEFRPGCPGEPPAAAAPGDSAAEEQAASPDPALEPARGEAQGAAQNPAQCSAPAANDHPPHRADLVRRFADIVGQSSTVATLRTAVVAARATDEPVGHILLTGQPGLGKTTLARVVAAERGTGLHQTSAPGLGGPGEIVRLLTAVRTNDAVFLDEIHGLSRPACEMLYEAMENRRISLVLADQSRSRTVKLQLPPFTLIGATTDAGRLPEPLRERFMWWEHLDYCDPAELTELIHRAVAAGAVGPRAIDPRAAERLAAVSRLTPRRALRLLHCAGVEADAGRRCADGGAGRGAKGGRRRDIDLACAEALLRRMGIDERGLDRIDRRYLEVLRRRSPQRPMGLERVAACVGVDANTLKHVHEPHLFRLGLATTTPGGPHRSV